MCTFALKQVRERWVATRDGTHYGVYRTQGEAEADLKDAAYDLKPHDPGVQVIVLDGQGQPFRIF